MRETGGRDTECLVRKATTVQFCQANIRCAVHVSKRDRDVLEINPHIKLRKVSSANEKLDPCYPKVNVGFVGYHGTCFATVNQAQAEFQVQLDSFASLNI